MKLSEITKAYFEKQVADKAFVFCPNQKIRGNQSDELSKSFTKEEIKLMTEILPDDVQLSVENKISDIIMNFMGYISISYHVGLGNVCVNYTYEYLFHKSQHPDLYLSFEHVSEEDLVKIANDPRSTMGAICEDTDLLYPTEGYKCMITGNNLCYLYSYENHIDSDTGKSSFVNEDDSPFDYFIIPDMKHTIAVLRNWLIEYKEGNYLKYKR